MFKYEEILNFPIPSQSRALFNEKKILYTAVDVYTIYVLLYTDPFSVLEQKSQQPRIIAKTQYQIE